MTDIDRIINYMLEFGSITCKECDREIGTTELRRRICDIKDRGYEIGNVWETGENRMGVPTRYKRYFILKSPAEPKKTHCEPKAKPEPRQKSFWDLVPGIKKLTARIKKHTITKK